jgi:Secretion system C-terminal sorting domain
MKKIFTLLVALMTTMSAFAATFTSVQSGNWSDPATWGVANADLVPGRIATDVDVVTIAAGHTVTVDNAYPVSQTASTWTVSGLTIKGTATLDYRYNIIFNLSTNSFSMEANSNLIVNSIAPSLQNNALFFGTESFAATSTVEIRKWNSLSSAIASSMPVAGFGFGNLIINLSAAPTGTEWLQAGNAFTTQGTLTFQNLQGKEFIFAARNTTTYTWTFSGGMDIQNGTVRARSVATSATSTGSNTFIVGGNMSVATGCRFGFGDNGTSTSGTAILRVAGNLTVSGTAILERTVTGVGTGTALSATNPATGSYVEFNGAANQTVSIASAQMGSNGYSFRINNTGASGNNTVTGALPINVFTNQWLYIAQGLVGSTPTYGSTCGVAYYLNAAAAGNYTMGNEYSATIPKLVLNTTNAATNLIINSNLQLNDATQPLTLPSSGSNIGTITMGTNAVLTLGSASAFTFTATSGNNANGPSRFVNIGAAGSGLQIWIGVTSLGLAFSKNFYVGVGTTNADYRNIAITLNATAGNAPFAIKISTNTDGGGTASNGFNGFTSTRRFVLDVTNPSNLAYISSLVMTTGQMQEGLASYTAGDLRIGYATGSQSGTYAALPGATWSGNNNSAAANGTVAYSPSSNFAFPGTPMYLAYGVDAPKTAASGSWGDAATWTPSGVPGTNDRVIIPTAVTVTLDGASASPYFCSGMSLTGTLTGLNGSNLNIGGNATINSGGTMTIPTGCEISMGASCGDNKSFTNNGSLNLTGGTLVSNGQFSHSGGTFTMSGGELINDFNSGSAATSSSSFTTAVTISGGTTAITGGTITVNDPNYGGNGGAFNYTLANLSVPNLTLKMGGTVGNSGATCINNGVLSSSSGLGISVSNKLVIGNLIIAGPAATHYTNVNNLYVKNAITVPSGSELRILNNNLLGANNNVTVASGGILTTNGTLAFEDLDGAFAVTSPAAAQTLTANIANLRNFAATPTANFGSIKVNNTNGVTLALDNAFTMGGGTAAALTLTTGKLDIGSNSVSVLSGSSISGGSTTSYVVVNGTTKLTQTQTGTTATVYPIGLSGASQYNPATIKQNSAVTATFGVTVKNAITNTAGTRDPSLLVQREWDITRTGAAATSVDLTFKPDASALTVANTPPNSSTAIVGHWNGASWDANIASLYTTAAGWAVTAYAGSFSPFIVSAPGAVLAAEFTNISAQAKGSLNVINFTTATEKDVKEFAIERSINNKTWEVIGTKAAIGGTTPANYSFNDVNPTTLSYYRVRSVEANGKDQISKVVAVKRNGGKLAVLAVSPVPTTEGVTLDVATSKVSTLNIVITDIVGKVVKTATFTTVEGTNALPLNLSNLSVGTYIMTINDGETIVTQRVVKQ